MRGGKIRQPLPTQIRRRRVIGVICPRGNKSNGQFIKRQQCPFSSFSSRVWPHRPVTCRVRLSHFSSFFFFYTAAFNHLHIDRFGHFTVFWIPLLSPRELYHGTALLSRFRTSPLSYKWDAHVIQNEKACDIFSILLYLIINKL
jgi:hypothetical protein